MADSVDRVFGHALTTVNKIRTGGRKPALADRLRLYGLYKQAMEGDVSYIQPRPTGISETARREQERWDAWDANAGLSSTEAKRAYIEVLLRTVASYANETAESRALVSELEFVWNQIKDNSIVGGSSEGERQQHKRQSTMSASAAPSHAVTDQDEVVRDGEEFVDAPVSQYGEEPSYQAPEPRPAVARRPSFTEVKWRKRVESSLVKMTAEVAAMREQLENRAYIGSRHPWARRGRWLGLLMRVGWLLSKVLVVDAFMLLCFIIYLRARRKERLKGAIRVMLGDAQAVALGLAGKVQQVGTRLTNR